ncbi:hypothetical protein NLU13_3014 [Sarocladium strictum]|uniref:DUF2428 domain-containing protein n=1 Tax=Sarocladium strictum TaxID=5046 RepID=A0AA39GN08_SARSR|nr:hypothetical protein NLU13_3014 [Sarocladium strictum]
MASPGERDGDSVNVTQTAKWIEAQPPEHQQSIANEAYDSLLEEAAQPKSLVGHACIRLCGLVDQSAKSSSPPLKQWVFSEPVIRRLFDFYLEWNESDHTRSMKLVLDSLTSLLSKNPDPTVASSSRQTILDVLIPIVIGKSTKPAAKSALKILEHFLGKGVLTLEDLRGSFHRFRPEARQAENLDLWMLFLADLSHWMHSHFVRPQAGRFIACLYRTLVSPASGFSCDAVSQAWQAWLVTFLGGDSTLLEGVRNYVFLPLFRNYRTEAIKFLEIITKKDMVAVNVGVNLDSATMLQLAALETGKKVGLVEEPALDGQGQTGQQSSSLMLSESVFKSVLAHPSHDVRSVAFTLLITSPSTTKPYSLAALDLLRKHLGHFFADPDPKFRVDIAGKVRDMFKRVRGAICVLKRSIPRAKAKARKEAAASEAADVQAQAAKAIPYHANLITLPEAQLETCLRYHEDFLRWYLGFLCTELIPTASYQRHAASLRALHYILRVEGEASKTWETQEDQVIFFDLFGAAWARVLFDLTLDPFDDIRDLSAKAIVKLLSDGRYRNFSTCSQTTGSLRSTELLSHLQRANERAKRTARVDDSDGAARTVQALYILASSEAERTQLLSDLTDELERRIGVAQTDLGRAVLEAPLHGTLSSIGYTWQVVTEQRLKGTEMKAAALLQERLLQCCETVWTAVRDVLCDDSPEGHLPQDLDEVEGLDTKDLLSYCFRAVEESSKLMRCMVLALKYHDKDTALFPSPPQFERIGNLSFHQLATLRHRGAFTAVSLTFAACCQRTKFVKMSQSSLLTKWYQGTLEAISSQRSTTRRSAGIPSMITGILSANAPEPSFESVLERLMTIAATPAYTRETDGSKLPQVHAFNCLKEIYKNALLASTGNKSEKYLPQCLELAANGLKSEVWAIRNCGLIFLRSLIDSLFGSQESKAMIEAGWDGKANRIPYHRYPNLPTVLVNLLKSGHQMMSLTTSLSAAAAEAVFPALDIIRRAGPPDILRDELQTHIAVYLASPVWHVREIAARTLCSCLLHDKWLVTITSLIRKSLNGEPAARQNHCHGSLLTLKFVFERLGEVAPEQLSDKLPFLVDLLVEARIESVFAFSSEVQAAYLEVVNLIWAHQHGSGLSLSPLNLPQSAQAGGALQRKQEAISLTYLVMQRHDERISELGGLLLGGIVGSDTTVAVLEVVPTLWRSDNISDRELIALSEIYIDLCHLSPCREVQAQAMLNLAENLDRLLTRQETDALSEKLSKLWVALPLMAMNPVFANAITRASGGVMAALSRSSKLGADGLANWGYIMAEAGREDKDFDTRYAAAESLQSYFKATASYTSTAHIPSLLALYDALNDDDEDVRDVASHAAHPILGQLLVPLEAATRLTEWLAVSFPNDTTFRTAVLSRIAGDERTKSVTSSERAPASVQLANALRFDDALFAVEEQNLFIDEVRESERWVAVYDRFTWSHESAHHDHEALVQWLDEGLTEMQRLIRKESDGPLGWASRPDVFAISSRILLGSVAVAKNSPRIQERLTEVKAVRDASAQCNMSPLLSAFLESR